MVVDRVDQRLAAFAGQRRDLEDRTLPLVALDEVLHPRGTLILGHHVQLVQHQPARLGVQLGVVFLQLGDDGLGLLDRIDLGVERREVDDVQQQARALQVAQELVPQAGTFGRALDEPRNVGDDEALFRRDAHDTEVGVQRRERVIGNLGLGVRDRRDQRRLAGVGLPQQAYIGQHAQFEAHLLDFARPARRLLPRRAVGRGLEMQVAKAAIAALAQQDALARLQQLADHCLGFEVGDDGADGHAQDDIVRRCAEAVGAATGLAIARLVAARIAVVDQRVEVAVGLGPDAAAFAAITAVWPAKGNEFLAAKARAARAAVTGGDIDGGFVNEFHGGLPS
mmetsp:Transcript_20978/g.80913  ORF Transcript_20978/g.80913 Transcript_20978/m.80913 type:complete len:338 (-) Transcript_20978:524-1537(-)